MKTIKTLALRLFVGATCTWHGPDGLARFAHYIIERMLGG